VMIDRWSTPRKVLEYYVERDGGSSIQSSTTTIRWLYLLTLNCRSRMRGGNGLGTSDGKTIATYRRAAAMILKRGEAASSNLAPDKRHCGTSGDGVQHGLPLGKLQQLFRVCE
jgi:hypothetical protein